MNVASEAIWGWSNGDAHREGMTHRSFADTSPPGTFVNERSLLGRTSCLALTRTLHLVRRCPVSLSDVCGRRRLVGAAELPKIERAVVCRQEVQESLVVLCRDAEERQHRTVVPVGVLEASFHQLAQVVAGHVPLQEAGVNVAPEREVPILERFV